MKPAILSPVPSSPRTSVLLSTNRDDRTISEHHAFSSRRSAMFFTFPDDARWNADHETVEFSVIIGQYEGTVRIGRRVFQHLLDQSPTPERCVEAFHLQRTRFELIVEKKRAVVSWPMTAMSRSQDAICVSVTR